MTGIKRLKILYILDILKKYTDENNGIPLSKILSELEKHGITAERKSVYEDIYALRDVYGADIEINAAGGCSDYRLLSRDFELAELKLLVDAVQSSRFITRKKSDELISKLENLTAVHGARELHGQVYVTNRIKTMNETIYYNVDAVNAAIIANKKITFKYFEWTPDKKKKLRRDGKLYTVSPHALSWDNENYYLIAYNSETSDIRHYRVDKMLDITTLNEARDGSDSFDKFDAAIYSNKIFGMYSGKEQKVTVRFDNFLAGAVIDRFGNDVMMIPDGDTFTVTVNVQISPQFFAWLCGFGKNAKLVYPESAAKEFKEFIKQISDLY